jgi:transposase InsO family protein
MINPDAELPITRQCELLGISRSTYYYKPVEPDLEAIELKERIMARIDEIHTKHPYMGQRKIAKMLKDDGFDVGRKLVRSYMREMGIRAQWSRPWTTTTKDSNFSTELHNILDEQFNPDRPNAVWCSDITYIWTVDGFVYLTSIMDLYSRKIIAWTLSDSMEVSCVIDTVNKAKARRNTDKPLILHSDRGSQYVSKAYREATEKFQLSYSHKGYPYDNACIESFHSLIKREWLDRFRIEDYHQAYRLVFEYIEAFYNTVRIHSHCGYMSPDQFEKLYAKVIA